MDVTYFYAAMVVGLCISLLIYELFGITAGGMIVPGCLAMICDHVSQVLLIFAIAFLVFIIVRFILPRFVLLFGNRKFVAAILVTLIIKLILELLFPYLMPVSVASFGGIDVITTALIANCFSKQGIRYTVPATLIAAYLTFAIVTGLFWVL